MSKRKTEKIPTDADGFVNPDYLIEFESKRNQKSRLTDEMKIAGTVFAPLVTVKQAGQWMNRPNRYDIAGIDAPMEVANVPVGGFPRKKKKRVRHPNGPTYSQAFWDSLDWENDPVGASRMAAMAMEVEKHGLTEDMRALLEDDAYGEVMGSDRWKRDDRAAAEAYRRHMLSDMGMMDSANRRHASFGRKPYEWEKLAGNVYTIHDAEGDYIDVTKLKEKGPGWFACANAWGLPYTKFKTKEEAMDFAESLMGMGR
ncbi:hypothetical protein JS82_06025 [Methanomassiliicoccaceae archaeon DOK]|nr:hypothetical protein JS82_06025 [Methanomassiliicoccaceae archaeon DOK]